MSRKYGLRGYLEALSGIGQVVEVGRTVDANLEMGAIARLCYETGSAVPLFSDVAGAPAGFQVVSALVGTSSDRGRELARLGLSLFLSEGSSAADIVEELCRARRGQPIEPNVVFDAPCKENISTGEDVDLTRLPAPLIHHGDGGRYVNTIGVVVTRSADGAWTNWSINRVMVTGPRSGVVSSVPVQHIGMIHESWRKIGQDMPFAVALGVDPALLYAASMPLPAGASEVGFAGSLLNRPVDVIRCESSELEVPADAEIVLEGRISNTDVGLEGPFGDFTGYFYPNYGVPQPMAYFDTVTYRNRPIYPFTSGGEPPSEEHTIWGVATAAEALHRMRLARLPIASAWSPFASCNGWLVVTVRPGWSESGLDAKALCRRVGEAVWGCKAGDPVNSVIVTEDDIDPGNLNQVVWAMDSRNDRSPGGRLRIEDRLGWPMSPYLDTDHFRYFEGWKSSRLIYDCLPSPLSWPAKRSGFASDCPPAVREKVLRNWTSDGFAPIHGAFEAGDSPHR
ncbi:UbiD family decarboxylase [Kutzneria sp. CA-103260]|uniref:UbiD family decarboxylase n=1 Tax=Kutzneria sp. CA-103260 TaxID=2802641 RepID=UPI001BA99A66|nr:UbiD family decarboxylase [Kutzneria sp. CA-103260]QUQ72503.1 menaquinone biosynthesis decarboxylase [Kutzneria sp. CA-103260]